MNLFFDNKYSYAISTDLTSLEQFFDKKCEEDIYNDSLLGHSVKYQLNKSYNVFELEYIQTTFKRRTLLNIHLLLELSSVDEQTVKIECVTKYCTVSKILIVGLFIFLIIAGILFYFFHPKSLESKIILISVLKFLGSISIFISILFLKIKWDKYAHKEIIEKWIKEFENK